MKILKSLLALLVAGFLSSDVILAVGTPVPAVSTFIFQGSSDGSEFSVSASLTNAGSFLVGGPGNQGFVNESTMGSFIIPNITVSGIDVFGSGAITMVNGAGTFSTTGFNFRNLTTAGVDGLGVSPNLIPQRIFSTNGTITSLSGTISGLTVSDFGVTGVSTFEQLFRLGTFEGTAGSGQVNLIRFIFISGLPSQETQTIDFGAITSAQTTGLTSISTSLTNLQNVTQSATRDLNSRLFRARSGVNRPGPTTVSTLDSDSSRYLEFAANHGIDSRVALGLADGAEVPVNAHVTGAERTGATITVPIGGSAKAPLDGKIVINDEVPSRFEVFTEFDFGYYDQDDLSTAARGFDSDTFGSTLGAEYRVSDNLHAGVALTHQTSDAEITGGLGSSDLEGQIFSAYFTTFRGDSFVDFLYSYGDYDNEVTRNTLLGSVARGDTESDGHSLSLNSGTLLHRTESFSFGPTLGFDYATGTIDGYTETGGGTANLVVPDHDFESAVTRLGGVVNFYYDTNAGNVTSQLRAAWAHEFSPENGVVTAALQTSPFAINGTPTGGFTASQNRGRVGTDWLELGATTRIEFDDAPVHLELGYQSMLGRDRAVAHYGSLRIGYYW